MVDIGCADPRLLVAEAHIIDDEEPAIGVGGRQLLDALGEIANPDDEDAPLQRANIDHRQNEKAGAADREETEQHSGQEILVG